MPRGSSPPAPPAAASNHPHNPHLDVAVTCLWILTPLSATLSLVIVCIAMTTNHWLHTEEKMNNPNYNGTGDKDYLSKYTVSGLWTLCYTNHGATFASLIRWLWLTSWIFCRRHYEDVAPEPAVRTRGDVPVALVPKQRQLPIVSLWTVLAAWTCVNLNRVRSSILPGCLLLHLQYMLNALPFLERLKLLMSAVLSL